MQSAIYQKIGRVILTHSGVLNEISNVNVQLSTFGIFVSTKFKERVVKFNSGIRPKNLLFHTFCRVGSKYDGGYVIPKDFTICNQLFSIGLGKNIDFEKEFLKISKKNSVLGADLSVDVKLKNFKHIRKNIASNISDTQTEITINSFLKGVRILTGRSILKVDCEGFEVSLFNDIELDFLKKFRILVIEVHNIPIQLKGNYVNFQKMFKRIQKYHDCVHAHANNGVPIMKLGNVDLINTFEFTFVNRKYYKTRKVSKFKGPKPLDMPTIKFLPDHVFTL